MVVLGGRVPGGPSSSLPAQLTVIRGMTAPAASDTTWVIVQVHGSGHVRRIVCGIGMN